MIPHFRVDRAALADEYAGYDGPRGPKCEPINCPDCGRFSAESWSTELTSTENGWWQEWGGVCKVHGRWSDGT